MANRFQQNSKTPLWVEAVFAWFVASWVGTFGLMVRGFIERGFHPVKDMAPLTAIIMFPFVAAVAFCFCLLIVTPVLYLIPARSPVWQPWIAACVGSIFGSIAMYPLFWDSWEARHSLAGFMQVVTPGTAVGATFGYLVARKAGPRKISEGPMDKK